MSEKYSHMPNEFDTSGNRRNEREETAEEDVSENEINFNKAVEIYREILSQPFNASEWIAKTQKNLVLNEGEIDDLVSYASSHLDLVSVEQKREVSIYEDPLLQQVIDGEEIEVQEKVGLQLLHVLDLSSSEISLLDLDALFNSGYLGRVRELDLSNREIGSNGARNLAERTCLSQIELIDLRSGNIGPEGVAALARSEHLGNLKELHLRYNDIGPDGMKELAESEKLTALEVLHVEYNNIGDLGAKAFAESSQLKKLKVLSLVENNIGPEGAAALASSEKCRQLDSLDMSRNRLGDESVFDALEKEGVEVLTGF